MKELSEEIRLHIHQIHMPKAHAVLLILSVLWSLSGFNLSDMTKGNYSQITLFGILPTYFFFIMELMLVGADLYLMYGRFVLRSFFYNILIRCSVYIGFAIVCGWMYVQTGFFWFLFLGIAASSGLKFEEIWAQNNIDRYISQHKKGIYERVHRPKKIK